MIPETPTLPAPFRDVFRRNRSYHSPLVRDGPAGVEKSGSWAELEKTMNSWVELSPYWITADRMVSQDPVNLWGFVVVASADGGSASLYRKSDPSAEELMGTFTALASTPLVVMFPRAVPCPRGLYVDLVANVTGVLVLIEPIFQPPG